MEAVRCYATLSAVGSFAFRSDASTVERRVNRSTLRAEVVSARLARSIARWRFLRNIDTLFP